MSIKKLNFYQRLLFDLENDVFPPFPSFTSIIMVFIRALHLGDPKANSYKLVSLKAKIL
jgi:hypothetical protein